MKALWSVHRRQAVQVLHLRGDEFTADLVEPTDALPNQSGTLVASLDIESIRANASPLHLEPNKATLREQKRRRVQAGNPNAGGRGDLEPI